MKHIRIFCVLILVGFAAIGCNRSSSPREPVAAAPSLSATSSPGPSPADLKGLDASQALALANEWKGNGVTTNVTTRLISFEFPDGNTVSTPLPADKMVVAIAPYISKTHRCEIHSISGCQGELVNVSVNIVAKLSDGTIVVNETVRTMANGFVELWLPRNEEVSVSMEAEGKSVTGMISTLESSKTCVTTFQLL